MQPAMIANMIVRKELVRVTSSANHAHNYPSMLDATIGVEKFAANGANLWTLSVLKQSFKPIAANDLNIVVE